MNINVLIGKTATNIINTGERITFIMDDGSQYAMLHYQSCCENVRVEDVCGDLNDLLNTPFIVAEERSNSEENADSGDGYTYESATWTFYELGTNKGSVTIRWLGTSNGYYSEAVDFIELGKSTIPDGYSFAY